MLDNQKAKDNEHQKELAEQKKLEKKNRAINWITFGITTVLAVIVLVFTVLGYFKP